MRVSVRAWRDNRRRRQRSWLRRGLWCGLRRGLGGRSRDRPGRRRGGRDGCRGRGRRRCRRRDGNRSRGRRRRCLRRYRQMPLPGGGRARAGRVRGCVVSRLAGRVMRDGRRSDSSRHVVGDKLSTRGTRSRGAHHRRDVLGGDVLGGGDVPGDDVLRGDALVDGGRPNRSGLEDGRLAGMWQPQLIGLVRRTEQTSRQHDQPADDNRRQTPCCNLRPGKPSHSRRSPVQPSKADAVQRLLVEPSAFVAESLNS